MYIGQAAQRSGTTIKSIRHYEAIGLMPPAKRQGNYRVYDQQSVDRLGIIKCAQQLGFKLKELQGIFAGQTGQPLSWADAQQAITDKKREINDQIAALTQRHAQLVEFEDSLQNAWEHCPLEPK
jgi:DNA-binding transcriptional MerR regulator